VREWQGPSESTSKSTIGDSEPFHASRRNELAAIDVATDTTAEVPAASAGPLSTGGQDSHEPAYESS
jgi:hypothetical protein